MPPTVAIEASWITAVSGLIAEPIEMFAALPTGTKACAGVTEIGGCVADGAA